MTPAERIELVRTGYVAPSAALVLIEVATSADYLPEHQARAARALLALDLDHPMIPPNGGNVANQTHQMRTA